MRISHSLILALLAFAYVVFLICFQNNVLVKIGNKATGTTSSFQTFSRSRQSVNCMDGKLNYSRKSSKAELIRRYISGENVLEKDFSKQPFKQDGSNMEITPQVLKSPENLMDVGPFQFMDNYKNPCWCEASGGVPISCLPYFYLLGTSKCGTSDLYLRLAMHPQIAWTRDKEPTWLSKRHYGSEPDYSFRSYLRYFQDAIEDVYNTTNPSGFHSHVFGDYTPSTLYSLDYWRVLETNKSILEPAFTTADYIHHLNPRTKIIILIRNPVDRLWSEYVYKYARHKRSPDIFHNGIDQDIKTFLTCTKKLPLRHCLYTHPHPHQLALVRLRVGFYHQHIQEVLRVFPREQVLILKLEDHSRSLKKSLMRVFNFLELDILSQDEMEIISNTTVRVNKMAAKDIKVGEMRNDTRRMLQRFYKIPNQKLGQLLGENFNYNKDYRKF